MDELMITEYSSIFSPCDSKWMQEGFVMVYSYALSEHRMTACLTLFGLFSCMSLEQLRLT